MHRSCFSLIPLRPAAVWRQWSHPTAPLTCAWIDSLRPPSQSGCTPCRFSRDAEACAELTVNSSMTLGLLVCREEVRVKSWTIGHVFFFYFCETVLWSAFSCHSLIHLFLAWICPCTLALSPLVCQRKKGWTYSVVWTHCLDELDAAAALQVAAVLPFFWWSTCATLRFSSATFVTWRHTAAQRRWHSSFLKKMCQFSFSPSSVVNVDAGELVSWFTRRWVFIFHPH